MNTQSLITLIREKVEETGYKCFSPDLPQEGEECVSFRLSNGENQRAINQNILYSEIDFYILIRGTENDTESRQIADKVFDSLDMLQDIENDDLRVILISCRTPNYAFRDENQRIYYNISGSIKVEWRN